jgi:hypothetical protein
VGEAQKVWDFLGQAESALVPFGFSPRRSGHDEPDVRHLGNARARFRG